MVASLADPSFFLPELERAFVVVFRSSEAGENSEVDGVELFLTGKSSEEVPFAECEKDILDNSRASKDHEAAGEDTGADALAYVQERANMSTDGDRCDGVPID